MRIIRTLSIGFAAIAVVAGAMAQNNAQATFDGPAPVAWRWMQPTTVPPSGAPLVIGDTVYTAVGNRIFALYKDTGNLRWRFPAVDPIVGVFKSSPLLVQGMLVAAGDNKTLYGVDPGTGQSKWTYVLTSSIVGDPVVVGNNVAFATSDDKLNFLDPTTGQPLTKAAFPIPDGVYGNLAAINNSVLVFTRDNQLLSVNSIDPKIEWHQTLTQLPPGATPVVFGGNVYLCSGPYLISLNGSTGFARWQVSAPTQLSFAPSVSDRGVMVVTMDGQALVYDLMGQPIMHTETAKPKRIVRYGDYAPVITDTPTTDAGQKITTNATDIGSFPIVRPTPVGDKFIVPTSNGAVNLVDPYTGQVLWSFVIPPTGDTKVSDDNSNQSPGRGGGLAGGPGGFPGGPGGIPGAPGRGNSQSSSSTEKVLSIPASGPAVVTGTTLLVPAKDGSILAFDKFLGVDLTPPDVKMIWPTPGAQVSGQGLDLFFDVVDEASGVRPETMTITIDGKPVDFTLGLDNRAQVHFSAFGKNKPLTDGRKQIVVTVTDWMGNKADKTYTLMIDNTLPPTALPTNDQNNGPGRGPGRGGPGGPGGRGGRGGPGGGIGL